MNIHETNALVLLKEHIAGAIQAKRMGKNPIIDLNGFLHSTITEALYDFVFTDGPLETIELPFLYQDGSKGQPFPFLSLMRRPDEPSSGFKGIQPLRASLISMRHLAMDKYVDMAWLINKDLPSHCSEAEVEAYSYMCTQKQLQEALKTKPLKLCLYQTGFQPAVVGFYHALVEELMKRAHKSVELEVIPYAFASLMGCYQVGRKVWH